MVYKEAVVFLSEAMNLLMGFPFDFIHGLCLSCPGTATLVRTHGLSCALPSRVGDEKERSTVGVSCVSQGISGRLGKSYGTAGGGG